MLGHGGVGCLGEVLGDLSHHLGPYLRGEGCPQIAKGRWCSDKDEVVVGPVARSIRKCVGQSMHKVPLQLPVRIGMGLDGRAGRPHRAKTAASSYSHEFVGCSVVALPYAALECLQPITRTVILQNAC